MLAGLDAGAGLDAFAIDADLALAHHFLQLALGEVREAPPEPAVQPCAGFALLHLDRLNTAHAITFRMIISPTNSAATAASTEAVA